MTGLPSRERLDELSETVFGRMQRGECVAVVLLDIDGFQILNDSFGHQAGDAVLAAVGRRLKSVVRDDDVVVRMGADEFAVVCEHVTGLDEVTALARRFLTALRAAFSVHEQQVFLGANIGIALSTPHTASLVELAREADTAMYRARSEHEPWAVYDPQMRERSRTFLAMATDLRHAVTRRQLRVEYQPIVSLPEGGTVALEALVRWDHPQRGAVRPDEFIPAAERAGMICEIGEWVLHQAVSAAVRWGEMSGSAAPRVSVNVSAHQLRDADFIYTVTRCLEQWQLPFDRLILEVTESAVIENVEVASESLRVLSGLGVQIAIDDFGTGASSLSQLRQLSWVDILKIDKSFVDGLGDDEETCAIVTAVVSLARALNLHVVAEGVELPRQAAELSAAGCDCAQGWYFGRPLRPRVADQHVRGEPPSRVPMELVEGAGLDG